MGVGKEVDNVRMLRQGGNPNILHNVQPHVMFSTMGIVHHPNLRYL